MKTHWKHQVGTFTLAQPSFYVYRVSPVIFDSFESLLNYGVLREKEEIQVSDPSYPGGAHRGAFCQRRPLLQAPAAGWRFCRYFFQVNTPENNLKRFFTHAKHCLKYHVVVSYSLEAVTGGKSASSELAITAVCLKCMQDILVYYLVQIWWLIFGIKMQKFAS